MKNTVLDREGLHHVTPKPPRSSSLSSYSRHLITGFLIFFLAIAWAYTIDLHLLDLFHQKRSEKILIFLLIATLCFALFSRLRHHWVPKLLIQFSGKAWLIWFAAALAGISFFVITIPYQLPPIVTLHTLVIEATGGPSQSTAGANVEIIRVLSPTGDPIPWSDFEKKGKWEVTPDGILVLSPLSQIQFSERFLGGLTIEFRQNINSGQAAIQWDRQRKSVDLYESHPDIISYPTDDASPGKPNLVWGGLAVLSLISDFFTALSAILFTGIWAIYRKDSAGSAPHEHHLAWLGYASPCWLTWSIYVLAYFPGLMSFDSADVWMQAVSGQYVSLHPILYTLLIRLGMAVWNSPAVVAGIQIGILGLAIGYALSILDHLGIPKWVCWVTCLVLALSPVNGLLAITLWKDVPYSAGFLLLVVILIKLMSGERTVLKHPMFLIGFGLLLAGIALLRVNGIPVALLTILSLMGIYRKEWRRWLVILSVAVGCYIFVTIPLSHWLKVRNYPTLETLTAHQMAAFVSANVALSDQEESYLNSIYPLDSKWGYNCRANTWTLGLPDFKLSQIVRTRSQFMTTLMSLIRRYPQVYLNHLKCSSSMLWQTGWEQGEYYETYIVNNIEENGLYIAGFTVQSASIFPSLRDWISKVEAYLASGPLGWLFWRPAIYLYLLIAVFSILAIRKRSITPLIPLIPVVIQTLSLTFTLPSQAFRYQYGVVLAASCLWGMIFLPQKN